MADATRMLIIPDGGSAFQATVVQLPPLTFWGPLPGFPTPPIAGIPGLPGYEPPSIPPGGQPPTMGEPKFAWEFVQGEGWYLAYGPLDKPRPMPPEFEGGKWQQRATGVYYVMGPYDKPKPIGPIEPPPVDPPVQPAPPKYKWEYRDDGWYFIIGPFDKPKPQAKK